MADTKVSALTENTAPLGGDYLYQVDAPSGTPASRRMTIGNLQLANGQVQGGLINGYISRTVASNNLTVALKTLAGGDPSALDPVYVRIGNSVRKVIAALSVTKNAGTNWGNAGGVTATKEVDWFIYMGYNATDGTVIGFSRYPGASVYSDFSATTTNEKFCAISTITTAASTDEYEVVGRANITLSAGAGYTWSVPATSLVLSRPIYKTRWLDFVPILSASGSLTWGSTSVLYAQYIITYRSIDIRCNATGTAGGTASNILYATAPFEALNIANSPVGYGYVGQAATVSAIVYMTAGTPDLISVTRYDAANFTNSGTTYIHAGICYAI